MTDSEADKRETAEPPEGQQNREREGPGGDEPAPQTPGEQDRAPEKEDEDGRVDEAGEDTFPASDPPGNY